MIRENIFLMMEQALKDNARKKKGKGSPIACVIFDDKNIYANETNHEASDEKFKLNTNKEGSYIKREDTSKHAEINSFKAFKKNWPLNINNKVSLIITIMPCKDCLFFLKEKNIDKIYYLDKYKSKRKRDEYKKAGLLEFWNKVDGGQIKSEDRNYSAALNRFQDYAKRKIVIRYLEGKFMRPLGKSILSYEYVKDFYDFFGFDVFTLDADNEFKVDPKYLNDFMKEMISKKLIYENKKYYEELENKYNKKQLA